MTTILNIGARRELFIDDLLIERLTDARLQLQKPERREVAFTLDTAGGWGWGIYCAWVTPRLDLRLPNIPADEVDRPDNHAGA
ncbi:MAG: hypothetical protein ACYTGH_19460 [Planctomycetota bacterium]